jgi:peroxin-2
MKEFLLFLMPLVNIYRLRLRIARFLTTTASNSKSISLVLSLLPSSVHKALNLPTRSTPPSAPTNPSLNPTTKTRPLGPLHFLPDTTCPICYSISSPDDLPPTNIPLPLPVLTHTDSPAVHRTSALSSSSSSSSSPTTTTPGSIQQREGNSIQIPYLTNCGWECRYCYYCVVSQLASKEEEGELVWKCLRCLGDVTGVRREVIVRVEEELGESDREESSSEGDEMEEPEEEDEEEEEESDEEGRPYTI